MRTDDIVWNRRTILHIARHDVKKSEVEEVLSSKVVGRRIGKNKYKILGETLYGRLLTVFLTEKDGDFYINTARPMDKKEKSYYRRETE